MSHPLAKRELQFKTQKELQMIHSLGKSNLLDNLVDLAPTGLSS